MTAPSPPSPPGPPPAPPGGSSQPGLHQGMPRPTQREGIDYETVWLRRGRGTGPALLFLALVLAVGGFAVWRVASWARGQVDPPGEPGAAVVLELPTGSSTSGISAILEEAGVIPDATAYEWYVRLKGGPAFQAGEYTFYENSSVWEALDVLRAGPDKVAQAVQIRVTVPEGLTFAQIVEAVDETEDLPFTGAQFEAELRSGRHASAYAPSAGELPEGAIEPYEGLLFPDTYFLATDATAAELVDQMIGRMDQVMTDLGYGELGEESGLDAYDLLIVASLIEREARVPNDRAKISRVIHNRLAVGERLGIDATVVYTTGDNEITAEDLATESPYNTRLVRGLPPTPIASPGRAALEAAIAPAPGQWMFYVLADESGRHAFSVTQDEFLRDKARCQELGLCG
jgi:UPF0755 protein